MAEYCTDCDGYSVVCKRFLSAIFVSVHVRQSLFRVGKITFFKLIRGFDLT